MCYKCLLNICVASRLPIDLHENFGQKIVGCNGPTMLGHAVAR